MKFFKTGLIATLVSMSGLANAEDKTALSLMALKSGSTSVPALAPEVRNISNGVITEIELEDYKDKVFAFEFKVIDLEQDFEHSLSYSVMDGSLLEHKKERLSTFGFSDLEDDDREALNKVTESNFDIVEKIPELEERYNAKMIEVELESEKGIVYYEMKMVSSDKGKQKLLIDVATGEEIPVLKKRKSK